MGPVMADRHFQHNFFAQSPLSSTLYITTDNNNNSPATPPSSSPSSPSISSGRQEQHQHYHLHQYHSLHDHNPHQHSAHHTQISASSTDQSSSTNPPIPVDDKKGSGGYGGGSFPPDTYFAHAVARYLLPDGPSMFGRRSDANCILAVGDVKYYVHVPMLASRCPMFRRIFSDMIDEKAWGPNGDTTSDDYSTSSNINIHDEQHDDLDDGLGYDGHDLLSEEGGGEGGGGGGWSAHASTPTSLSTSTTETTTTTARTSTTSMSTTPSTSVTSTTMDADSSMDEDQNDCYDDKNHDEEEEEEEDDDDDNDEELEEEDGDETEQQQNASVGEEAKELPVLTVKLADPVGSRFDELLYWIYTDKSDRWLTHFTPQNYGSILQNIAFLNLATPAVLAICRAFEQSPANTEGVVPLGTADGYFTLPSTYSSSPILRIYPSFP